jgi:uncharacterized protein (TIGR02246 family)
MRTIPSITLVAILAVAGGHAQSASQAPSTRASSLDAGIRAVSDQYVKAALAGDAKGVADLYTEDAVEMPPNSPPIKGRAAIQQYYEKVFGEMKLSRFTLTHLETRGLGDAGYDVGTYQQNMTPAGAAALDETGKFAVILKRTGGRWRVAYAIYNSDRPAR